MKYIPYAAQMIDCEDINSVSRALKSDFITQGPKVKEFEQKVADYCGVKYAVALNSGTSALHAACFAAGINTGDEVITSPITFAASANCILYCRGIPVFSDIQEDTVNIDPKDIVSKLTRKTRAIIPVHFSGHPCDMDDIYMISRKSRVVLIEDAAHALGAEYKNSKIGSCKYSDMAVLSFHAVKHITTGEGGMVLTNKKCYYDRMMMFRSHGITKDRARLFSKQKGDWYYEMQYLGYNYRITDFQCALGIRQLEKLDRFIGRRREIVKKYNSVFRSNRNITLLVEKDNYKSACHIYVILVTGKRRHNIFDALRKSGIGVNVHYLPVYLHPYYRTLGYKNGICPKAEDYYRRGITLPLYPKMTDKQVDFVISMVTDAVNNAR